MRTRYSLLLIMAAAAMIYRATLLSTILDARREDGEKSGSRAQMVVSPTSSTLHGEVTLGEPVVPPHTSQQVWTTRVTPATSVNRQHDSTSILFWNINLASDAKRLDGIGAALQAHGVTVAALCEVPWSAEATEQQATRWGYAHHAILRADGRKHRFNIAILSQHPIERLASVHAAPFFHGCLCVSISLSDTTREEVDRAPLVLCATHLTPGKPQKRREEALALRKTVLPDAMRLASSSHLLLVGDMNALSSADATVHTEQGLARRLMASNSWAKFSLDGRLDYRVMDALTRDDAEGADGGGPRWVGLVDLVKLTNASSTQTVPTQRTTDPSHAAPMRLDFALATDAMLRSYPGTRAQILTGDAVSSLSDHFPVLIAVGTHEPRATQRPMSAEFGSRLDTHPGGRTEVGCGGAIKRDDSRYDQLMHSSECRALSGFNDAIAAALTASVSTPPRCAVVGSSGSLLDGAPRGSEIDGRHDVIIRLNAAPVSGYEPRVGKATTIRLVNAPQSNAWAKQLKRQGRGRGLPGPIKKGEILFVQSNSSAWSLVEGEVQVRVLSRAFRKRCVLPLFSDADLDAHRSVHGNEFTPTFGMEAIAHALTVCESVSVYGFYVPPVLQPQRDYIELRNSEARLALPRQPDGRADGFRYHYWQESFVDKSSLNPTKPWTYSSHNYAIESARIRHMGCRGVLNLAN